MASQPHACALYSDEGGRRRILTDFVIAGVEAGQKVICALEEGQGEILRQDLAGAGHAVEELEATGHLEILASESAHLPNGAFRVDRGLGRIRELIADGLEEGFSGIRTVGDLGWLERAPDLREAFFEYEAEVNRLLAQHDSLALCMYPRTMLSTGDQLRCLSVHPAAHVGQELLRNPFFVSPEGLRGRDPIETSLSWRREAVRSVTEAERTRHLLGTVLDSVEAAVLVVDRDGREVTECNQAAVRMFGYPREVLVGLPTRELHVDEAHWEEFGEFSFRVLDEGREFRSDFQMRRADGTIFPTRNVVTLLDPASGRDGGVVSTVRDRTDEVDARRREVETRARFRAIAESITDGVLTIDTDHRIVYANPAAHRMMGVDPGALQGMPMTDLMPVSLREPHRSAVSRYLETGEKRVDWSRVEMPVVRPDGTSFSAEISFGEYMARGRRYFTGVIRDATARIRLESELRQSQKMEAVGRLASGVAHDFNNLLTLIRGSSELLRQDLGEDSPHQADLTDIVDGVERAAALTRQLLAFSRAQVLETRAVDLAGLLSKVELLLKRVVPSRIDFHLHREPGSHTVRGDANELHRVLLNLVLNASDAIEGTGRIEVSIRSETLTGREVEGWNGDGDFEAGPYVRLQVSDDGAGIPAEILDRIFDPFFTTKPEGHGTGLGLSSVLGIVQQMGGHIEAHSVVGEGATFDLYFPETTDEEEDAADEAVDEGGTREGTILVVEDDEALARVLARALERKGHQVLSARDGDDAVRIAADSEVPIDIVLSDVVMPGARGSELLQALRRHHPGVRLILMSGHGSEELAGQIPPDTEAFLAKPFSPETLTGAVQGLLAKEGRP